MDEKDNSRSSLQTAADLGRAAKAAYRIAQAAAVSGVHGAAAAAVKETVPALVKFLLAVLLIMIVIPMVIFTALPNIFFGYDSSDTASVIHMTEQAMRIGGAYMSLDDFERTQIDSIVTGIAAEYEADGTAIDHIEVKNTMKEDDLLWIIAINSAAYEQDLDAMSAELIQNFCRSTLSYQPSLSLLGGSTSATLEVEIKRIDPEELMEQMGFNEDARQWAGALFETLKDSGALEKYGGYFSAYQPDYSGDGSYSGDIQHGTSYDRAFLQAALEGDVPNLTLSYHDAAIERRVRLSALMMTAYHAGINVFTITANSLAEPSTLFITAITRSRGHNPWGSARVGAIAHLGSTYYAVHYIYSGIGRMAVNDELAAFHNHTNFGKDTQRAFLFAGASYADIIEELKVRDEKRDTKLIRYSEAYRGLHYPVHLLSCDETGARQLQIMAVPDYRVKLAKLMLRSAYRPPPEDAPAWDATYQNRPFVIGADMNLRRIDTAIASAKKRGCLPISLAALDAQGDAVLLRRYKDTGYAVIYKVTESVLTELFGRPPSLYLPPCTQYLTKKGDVVDAPLIQVDRKDRRLPRK